MQRSERGWTLQHAKEERNGFRLNVQSWLLDHRDEKKNKEKSFVLAKKGDSRNLKEKGEGDWFPGGLVRVLEERKGEQ